LPLALHLPAIAALFSILNALVLFVRIRAENRGLASPRTAADQAAS
jgi:methyltransferase